MEGKMRQPKWQLLDAVSEVTILRQRRKIHSVHWPLLLIFCNFDILENKINHSPIDY